MTESKPTHESPEAGADVQGPSASRSGPLRFIAVLLTGILLVLAGILYVMIENQEVIIQNQEVMIENQNKSLEHQRAKEVACEVDGGEISWNTRGSQVCDLSPFARDEGGRFDFDVDWIIR
ncbi:MAG: hypothetical protein OXC98_11980 [bacterium]|nr:hypothetical protein [Acidimicrobiia bacterium]MCY4651071.1 hypothetical protein [bacterium]